MKRGKYIMGTQNGKQAVALQKLKEKLKKGQADKLMNELAQGRQSGEEKGWLTLEAVEEHLGIAHE
jgi:hypothetical protein